MSTADAIAAGIQVIYQDFSIFPNLTVMENLAFNQVLAEKKKFVNKKEFRRIAEEAVRKINFDVDLDARVETLPVADKQLIAISRALLHNAKLIIMDEPTTALTKREVTRLFGIIEELKKKALQFYLFLINWMRYLKSLTVLQFSEADRMYTIARRVK